MVRKVVTAKVDDGLVAEVDAECEKRGVHRSDAVAEGLRLWLAWKPPTTRPAASSGPRSMRDEVEPNFKTEPAPAKKGGRR